ncbi:9520_t:CDS:2, partial [Acaulospora morrowiae]
RKVPEDEADSDEQLDEEQVDEILDEIVYEEENVKEKEGYYTGESRSDSESNDDTRSEPRSDSEPDDETRSEESSPAVYFAQIDDSVPLMGRDAEAETDDEKNSGEEKAPGEIVEKIESEGERTEEVVSIEELPTPMETTQEQRVEEKIETLKTDDELDGEQVEQVKEMLRQGQDTQRRG